MKSRTFYYLQLFVSVLFAAGCSGLNAISNVVAVPSGDPATVAYPAPATYFQKGAAIAPLTPTVTGSPSSLSILPGLPAGLSFDSHTGSISGTPTVAIAPTTFTVTALATDGTQASATVSFEVALPLTVSSTTDAADQTPGDQVCASAASQCTLRAALDEANALTGILTLLTVPAGTYVASSTLNMNARLQLVGDSSSTTIISGGNTLNKIISIGNFPVSLQNFAVKNGQDNVNNTIDGIGISSVSDDLTLKNCEISNNTITSTSNTLNISGVGLKSKSTSLTSSVLIDNCLISGNNLSLGGSVSSGNQKGGGAYLWANSVTVKSSTIQLNLASGGASGLFIGNGGGLYTKASILNLSTNTVSGNTEDANGSTGSGGGIYLDGGTTSSTTIDGLICDSNSAKKGGGCIYVNSGALTINNATVTNNKDQTASGGGILFVGNSPLTITNSYFDTGASGTVPLQSNAFSQTSLTIKNTTFNASSSSSIQLMFDAPANAVIENCTFINSGTSRALYKGFTAAPVSIKNSIFAKTGTGSLCFGDFSTVTSLGYNISQDATCTFFSAGLGDLSSTDPLVSAPANNGGLTFTAALASGSPARDIIPVGSCSLATDQRGTARPSGGMCDSGAYEY